MYAHHTKMSSCYGTRNLVELRVGKNGALQVQLHLRSCDVGWFNENSTGCISQLLSLISKKILPQEFQEELENTAAKKVPSSSVRSTNIETKKRKKASKHNDRGSKEETNANPYKSKPPAKKSKRFKAPKKGNPASSNTTREKDDKKSKSYLSTMETKYLFGDSIQITYRVKTIRTSHRATLSIKSHAADQVDGHDRNRNNTDPCTKSELGKICRFECLRLLPKLVIVWLYPFDPLNPKQPYMDCTDGFPRPELIPISSLFKEEN